MVRRMMIAMIFPLVLVVGTAYGDTWGTMTAPGSGWRATPTISDTLDDWQPNPTYFDGVDIYPGVWWQRDGAYEYFRMDLAGLPNAANTSDWATQYMLVLDTNPLGEGYLGIDELYGTDTVLNAKFKADSAGDTDTGLNLVSVGAQWRTSPVDWAGANLDSEDYFIEFTPSNQTLQWRRTLEKLGGNPSYRFCGMIYDEGGGGLKDMTECGMTPEPASMALMSLGLIGLAAFRKRRRED